MKANLYIHRDLSSLIKIISEMQYGLLKFKIFPAKLVPVLAWITFAVKGILQVGLINKRVFYKNGSEYVFSNVISKTKYRTCYRI